MGTHDTHAAVVWFWDGWLNVGSTKMFLAFPVVA